MIDLKDLRCEPDVYRTGAADKHIDVDIDALLRIDEQLRSSQARQQDLRAEKNRISRQIGQMAARLKVATAGQCNELELQMLRPQRRSSQIKMEESALRGQIQQLRKQRDDLWLQVPQPADPNVPVGCGSEENVEIRRWDPAWFDTSKSFEENKGFEPRSHLDLGRTLGLFDIERGVKMAGPRSYVLVGAGMRLHQAVLRFAFDFMVHENGFAPLSVPVLVRKPMMVGTGFFPHGKDQAYAVAGEDPDQHPQDAQHDGSAKTKGGSQQSFYLTGTGEVGLMGYHQNEILEADSLPRCYSTVSTCFRREAGAAGKDTAGLFRIHQFDKVEQVVICRADVAESRRWHQRMIQFVETLLQRLELPYRLLQCCTGDLGPKNADQIDIDCWMPSRGTKEVGGRPSGAYAETHSASRLYDYQCRRLNIRYRDVQTNKTVFCHALNNTVVASPRILIPLMELYQNADGSVTIPRSLRPYMSEMERITV